jgi:hypothetical protein
MRVQTAQEEDTMKKQDIKLGTVYAYKPHDWSTPEPLVFLSSELYETRMRRGVQEPFTKSTATRPKREEQWSSSYSVGYPVLIYGAAYDVPPDVLVLMRATKPTVIETGRLYDPTGHLCLTLLTRMASVVGEYDDVMEQIARQKDSDQRLREARAAESNRLEKLKDDLTARLRVLGIKVLKDYHHDDRLSFELDELDKLVGRLEGELNPLRPT